MLILAVVGVLFVLSSAICVGWFSDFHVILPHD